MREIVAESLIARLVDWGVDVVFGLPGDGINGIMEGLRRHRDRIRFVLVQHEEAAAFMATGYAKATGRLGVCLATSGPGGIHLLNGLYDARLDHVPVLAITGMQESSILGTAYQQEVQLDHLFADVAAYNLMVTNPQQLPVAVDLAIRTALAERTVSHLTFPNDVQVAPASAAPFANVGPGTPTTTLPAFHPPSGLPRPEDVRRAAEVLNAGRKVVMLVGAGALGARDAVLETADRLAAPVVKTLPGKAVVPDDHPLTTGGLGLLGTRPSEEAMEGADTLLLVGTNFPYTKYLPTDGSVRAVQIDIDPARIGGRLPTEVPIVADAGETLRSLLPLLRARPDREDREFLTRVQIAMDRWRANMAALRDARRSPIAPQYLIGVLDELAADDAILTCDSGTVATWAARGWTIRGDRRFYLSGNLASMACGLPYANAVQYAHPDRQTIAYVGDGGFAMVMAEFLTAVRHGLPVKVLINNNNAFGQILWEQMVLGFPEFGVRQQEPEADFAAWARACGAHGAKITEPENVRPALLEALAFDGPAIVDCHVDPNEPPMPGRVTYDQAKSFTQAFLRGQPHRASTLAAMGRDKISQLTGRD